MEALVVVVKLGKLVVIQVNGDVANVDTARLAKRLGHDLGPERVLTKILLALDDNLVLFGVRPHIAVLGRC
jgi:hypothetical protein